jgi:hypothetical protein
VNGIASSSDLAKRPFQILLIVSTLILSWLGMMIVHEFGHVLFAWVSGGEVSKVVLHPLEFSRTDLDRNPHPLFVVWGGVFIGTTLPLFALALCRFFKATAFYIIQFFTGFCLVVNGIYISVVSFFHAADPGEMIRDDSRQWVLVLFGVVTVPLGFYLWNGLGPHFGLVPKNGKVDRRMAVVVSLCLVVVVVTELAFNSH